MRNENIMYVKKTGMPVWGGVLLIIAGLLNIGGGIGATAATAAIEDFFNFDFTGAVFTGVPLIVIGVITIIGGIATLMRRMWWLALVGGILAVLPSPGWLFGVPGLILVSVAKPEFDFRDVLVEERAVIAEPVRTATASVNPAAVEVYLRGMDYPASKMQVASFAKSSGAPDAVMMYMNRLPDRQYNNSMEIEEEFGKIG